MTKEIVKSNRSLTLKQELFCQLYVGPSEFFGNGVQSYMEAYNVSNVNVAKVGAYENLKKMHILKRIDEILDITVFNDQAADKNLAFLMIQKAELGVSLGATKEYNKLKGRIVEKLEHKCMIVNIQSDNSVDQKAIDSIE